MAAQQTAASTRRGVVWSRHAQEEETRHVREQLTEEELVVFDLLTRPGPKLTTDERSDVKKVARQLLGKSGRAELRPADDPSSAGTGSKRNSTRAPAGVHTGALQDDGWRGVPARVRRVPEGGVTEAMALFSFRAPAIVFQLGEVLHSRHAVRPSHR